MTLFIAWIVAIVSLSFLWLRMCARFRREWEAYLAAEVEWLARVNSGEFKDAAAMNAAHPRRR